MMRLLFLLGLALPFVASAQSVSVTSPIPNPASFLILGNASCVRGDGFAASYALSSPNSVYCQNVDFFASSDSSCSSPDAGVPLSSLPASSVSGSPTGSITGIKVSSLPGVGNCGVNATAYVCGYGTYAPPGIVGTAGSCSSTNPAPALLTSVPLRLVYEGIPPDAPTMSVSELDGELQVSLTTSLPGTSDGDGGIAAASSTVFFAAVLDGGGRGAVSQQSNSSTNSLQVDITNLNNDQPYELTATVVDNAGNQSVLSAKQIRTPRAVQGFYGAFRSDGGSAGGCSATHGFSLLAVAGVAFALLMWRKA